MASADSLLNCGLLAIALVIRSRDGPRFVFHYPPHPSSEPSFQENLYGTELDQSDLDIANDQEDGSDDSDFEDVAFSALHNSFAKFDLDEREERKFSHVDIKKDDHYDTPKGEHVVPWENLFEFTVADLESILTPSRSYAKRKFQLSLDPLIYVSYPIHIREDGLWKNKKEKKTRKPKSDVSEAVNGASQGVSHNSEDDDDHGGMTMFNAVFIMNPSKKESDDSIAQMYEHVIKKFNKALKHAQASSTYVWKESEMILAMKEKAREERKHLILHYLEPC